MPLTFKEIAEIVRLIDASSCDELVVEVGDMRLAVRRKSAGTKQGALPSTIAASRTAPAKQKASAAPVAVTAGAPEAEAQVSESASLSAASTRRTDGLIEVRSPMVGIFYRKPAPDAEPFVSIGTQVNKGDPLCLMEVMKLYTTIEAEQKGRIVEIAAEDGKLVQHNEILFLIAPS